MKKLSYVLIIVALIALLFSCDVSMMEKGESINEYVFPYLEFTLSEDGTYYSASVIKGATLDDVYIPAYKEKDGESIPVRFFTGFKSADDMKNLKKIVFESSATALKLNADAGTGILEKIEYRSLRSGDKWQSLPELPHTATTEFLGWYTTDTEKEVKNGDLMEDGHTSIYAKTKSIELVHHDKVEATCLKDGSIEYWECESCHKYFKDENASTAVSEVKITSPGSHSTVFIDAVAVSCTEDGVKEHYECSRCHTLFSDKEAKTEVKLSSLSTKALGHVWTIKKGTTLLSCSYNECTRCGETSEEEGHSWDEGKVQTEATATSSGTTLYTCTKCKTTKTEDIAPLDTASHPHVWKDLEEEEATRDVVKHYSIAPTCEERGYTMRECTDCGVTYKYKYVDALGHKTKLTEAVQPTCTEWGNARYYTCSICEELFKDVNGINGTTSDEVKKGRAPLNHLYDENVYERDNTSHWHLCLRCTKPSEEVSHSYNQSSTSSSYLKSSATCTQAAVYYYSCLCGAEGTNTFTSGSALGHNLTKHEAVAPTCGTDGNIAYWSCSRCGKNFSDEKGTTEVANIVQQATGKHTEPTDRSEDETYHWYVCTSCNQVYEKAKHTLEITYDSNGSVVSKCSICGYSTASASSGGSAFEVDTALGNVNIIRTGARSWTLEYTGTGEVTYAWKCDKESVTIGTPNTKQTVFNVSESGEYHVTCEAKDASGKVVDIATAVLTAK